MPKHKMPMIPHSRPTVGRKESAAMTKVIQTARIAQGEIVQQFEEAVAARTGEKYAAAVNSGTSALHLTLLAFGIGENDEVIIPSYVCTALLNAVGYTGATPVLADIESPGYNLDPQDVKKRLTRRTKAVIVPHMFGRPADMTAFMSLGVPVIEDCAQAIGSVFRDKAIGTLGHAAVFSFYATKVMTTAEGGMVAARSRKIVDRVKDLREYDKQHRYRPRYNYKMTDLQAAMGLCQLDRLADFIKKRRRIAAEYDRAFEPLNVKRPDGVPGHIYFRYVVEVDAPDRYVKKMHQAGVACARPVHRPIHRHLGITGFKRTDAAWQRSLSIPIYPSLRKEEIKRVVRALTRVCGEKR